MSHKATRTEKCIGRIVEQPDEEALPEIERLTYPLRRHGRAAIATFKNGAELQYLVVEDGEVLRQVTVFPDGTECEACVIDTNDSPSKRLLDAVIDYQTIDCPTLRRSWPALWPVLNGDGA